MRPTLIFVTETILSLVLSQAASGADRDENGYAIPPPARNVHGDAPYSPGGLPLGETHRRYLKWMDTRPTPAQEDANTMRWLTRTSRRKRSSESILRLVEKHRRRGLEILAGRKGT